MKTNLINTMVHNVLNEEFSPFTDGFDGGVNLGGTY